ncbi:hypothetical protein M513_03184 [Trichuris suis]|uniref:Uncharacterized protein n=1 Tax=Trichuris suis TaxID=68888 RepID=A0A085MFR4_9BILA|nr:hypothetical protein M513_03184 [Trichuris suis]
MMRDENRIEKYYIRYITKRLVYEHENVIQRFAGDYEAIMREIFWIAAFLRRIHFWLHTSVEEMYRGALLHRREQRFSHCGSDRLARHNGTCAVLALRFYSTTSLTKKRPEVFKVAADVLHATLGVFCSAEQGAIANGIIPNAVTRLDPGYVIPSRASTFRGRTLQDPKKLFTERFWTHVLLVSKLKLFLLPTDSLCTQERNLLSVKA